MAFTKLYLTNRAAPYTPATLRGAWNDTAGAVTRELSPYAQYTGNTSVARSETNAAANYDVLLYRGVSGPLAAQTISGTLNVLLGVRENLVAADLAYHLHVYVTQGNSDTPRGTLLTDYVETTGNEWPTTAGGKALTSAQALSSLAVSAGDRLVVEIGYVALNAATTNFTGTLWYGTLSDTADLAAAGDPTIANGYLTFSSSITEAVGNQRVTQFGGELVNDGTSGDIRVSQFGAELVHDGTGDMRVSQFVVEVVHDGVPGAAAPARAWATIGARSAIAFA